uniref:Uncharacterized protein n=1 Tax=Globodera rostochiensis TaxID=31243 RepID=A0A914GS86_GLORO
MIKHNAKRQSNYRIMKWQNCCSDESTFVAVPCSFRQTGNVRLASAQPLRASIMQQTQIAPREGRRCERHKSCQKGSSRPSSISSLTLNRISWALTLGVTVANASTMCTRQEDSDIAHMLYKCSEGTGQSMDTDGQRRIGRTYCINVN